MASEGISNWRVARILVLGYLAVALILILTAWYSMFHIEAEIKSVSGSSEQAHASLLRIDGFANDGAQELFSYMLTGLEEELIELRLATKKVSDEVAHFTSIERLSELGNEEKLKQFISIQERWSDYLNTAGALLAKHQSADAIVEVDASSLHSTEMAFNAFFDQLDPLLAEKAAQVHDERRSLKKIAGKSELLIAVLCGVGVFSLAVITFLLLRLINSYVNQIRISAKGLQVRGAALDSISVGVYFTDPKQHEIVYVNDAFVQTTGYSRDEAVGQNWRFLQGPETDRNDIQELRESLTAGVPVSKLLRNYRKNGEPFWNQLSISPVHDINGQITHFVGATDDVTGRMEMESKLRHTQKMDAIGQLTGGIAHDFNNLLAVILGNLELLDDKITDSGQKKLIGNSVEATQRGAELTQNMLSFARQAPLEPTIVDLNQLVRNLKNWIGRTLPSTIDVETSLLEGLWPVKVDASSAESGLLNLILNARDAMAESGKLTIETSNVQIDEHYIEMCGEEIEPGRYVLLAVSDTGEGISPENVAKIFEPFFTTKPVGTGSGLGLSMLEGFMKQSGGNARVYSELGVGTTFKLHFAAATDVNEQVRVAPAPVEMGHVENGATILLVEDSAEVLETIRAALQKTGYRVLTAVSGDAAREVFEEEPGIDLLLTDIVMPGELQGTTLARALRDLRPDLPVVFMSGYAREAIVYGNGLRPKDIRLMKPVRREDLLRAVDKALLSGGGSATKN